MDMATIPLPNYLHPEDVFSVKEKYAFCFDPDIRGSHLGPAASISARNLGAQSCCTQQERVTVLPAIEGSGKQRLRYIWDGRRLVVVHEGHRGEGGGDEEEEEEEVRVCRKVKGRYTRRCHGLNLLKSNIKRWLDDLKAAFFPNPKEVTPGTCSENLTLIQKKLF